MKSKFGISLAASAMDIRWSDSGYRGATRSMDFGHGLLDRHYGFRIARRGFITIPASTNIFFKCTWYAARIF